MEAMTKPPIIGFIDMSRAGSASFAFSKDGNRTRPIIPRIADNIPKGATRSAIRYEDLTASCSFFDARIGWMPACATHAPKTEATSHDPILEIPIVSMAK